MGMCDKKDCHTANYIVSFKFKYAKFYNMGAKQEIVDYFKKYA